MSKYRPVIALLLLLLPGACVDAPPIGSASCARKMLARVPVGFEAFVPTVAAVIDGQDITMVLDTGAEVSVLSEAAVDRLHIPRDPSALPTITGVGGSVVRWAARPHRLSLGDLVLNDRRLEVAPMQLGHHLQWIGGALGADVLSKYDVDWDLPHGTVTLYAATGCNRPPPGWPSPAVQSALRHPRVQGSSGAQSKLMLLPVGVDDRPLSALLDTGSSISLISPARAAALEPPGQSGDRTVHMAGVGLDSPTGTIHRFNSLTVAGYTLQGVPMVIGAVPGWAGDMILSVGFMRLHRAWIPAGGASVWFGPRIGQ